MNEKGEFTYKGRPCSILYDDKKFYVAVYKDKDRLFTEVYEYLFPVSKFSKAQQLIAFDVANIHVLPRFNMEWI